MSKKQADQKAVRQRQTGAARERELHRAARKAARAARKATRVAVDAQCRIEKAKQREVNRAAVKAANVFDVMEPAVHELAECLLPDEALLPGEKKTGRYLQRTARKAEKAHRLIGRWLDALLERQRKREEQELARAVIRSLERDAQSQRRRRRRKAGQTGATHGTEA